MVNYNSRIYLDYYLKELTVLSQGKEEKMTSILKYLKEAKLEVLLIILLLIVQAGCDLALPTYMSNIVDTGLNGGGIEETVPDKITGYGLMQLESMMEEDDIKKLEDAYEKTDEKLDDVSMEMGSIENYVYEIKDDYKDDEELNDLLDAPMTMLGLTSKMSENMGDDSEQSQPSQDNSITNMLSDKQMDAMKVLQSPKATSDDKANAVEEFLDGFEMKDTIVATYTKEFIKGQYEDCGIDLDDYQHNYLVRAGIKMLVYACIGMIAAIIVGFIASKVGAKIAMNLRNKVFAKVVSFSNAQMDQFSTASLITRNTNDIQQIQMVLTMLLRIVLYAPVLCVGGILKVINTDLSMAWIIVVGAIAIICVVAVLFCVAMPKFKLMQKLVDGVNLVAREILTGLPVIRVFSRDKYEQKRFDDANMKLYKTQLFTNRVMTFMMPVMTLVMNGITLLVIWFGSKGIDAGNIQVGDMMAFMTYSMMIVMSFLMITMISIMLPRAGVAADRVNEVLNTEITIKEPQQPKQISGKGTVTFKNVSFKYSNADDNVLNNISFEAKPGQTTAIIGSTGSGKSTLINLIPRLYDVTDGQILIDGVDIREISKHDLRAKLGYVPQKGVLFSGTIASNIKYGKEDATDDEMKLAAQIAQSVEFIEKKEEGYDDPIAQGGSNVSGGQKQRLSIARAVAKKPDIFIFDDSFSALDFKTDKALRKALADNTGDSTVIIVAQRISTILHADQIIVLDDGKIAGIGTHSELLRNCDVYRQIAVSQLSQKEIDATLKQGQ